MARAKLKYRGSFKRVMLIMLVVLICLVTSMIFMRKSGSTADLTPSTSPLIFGTNLALDNADDIFLRSKKFREGLKRVHVQIIRFPVRGPSPRESGIRNWEELTQTARLVKEMGFVPMVILRSPNDPTLARDDLRVVEFMKTVFNGPDDVVYYEFGNEPDSFWDAANQVDVSKYVQMWNEVVPQLQAVAPKAKFIGPVTHRMNSEYLETFLYGAKPRPDAISWHVYTCDDNDDAQRCLDLIKPRYEADVQEARDIMKRTIGTQLPMMVTEWNFNSEVINGDADKVEDSDFVHKWTLNALQALADQQIAASMHFNVDNQLPLVKDDGAIAPQGRAFKEKYEALIIKPQEPDRTPTVVPTPTPSPTATNTPTPTPGVTATPTVKPSPTPAEATPTPVVTPTPGVTVTPTPVVTPTPAATTPPDIATPTPNSTVVP